MNKPVDVNHLLSKRDLKIAVTKLNVWLAGLMNNYFPHSSFHGKVAT